MLRSKRNSGNALNTDKEVIDEASSMQKETKKSIERIKKSMAETHEIGATTLAELEEQRRQLERIQTEGDRVEDNLKTTERLQNKLSRWSLAFNGRAARRKANEARSHEEKQEQIQEERKERLRLQEEASKSEQSSNVEITPHGKKKREMRRNKKKGDEVKSSSKLNSSNQKSLLYGSKGSNNDKDPDLARLEEEDNEINEELDAVGNQLDELMDMAKTMGNEVESHGRGLDDFTDQMTNVNHKQRVANNRTGRFLTGKVRRDYEKEGMNNATGFW